MFCQHVFQAEKGAIVKAEGKQRLQVQQFASGRLRATSDCVSANHVVLVLVAIETTQQFGIVTFVPWLPFLTDTGLDSSG